MTIQRLLNQSGFGGNYTTWYEWNTFLTAGWRIDASGSGNGGVYSGTGSVFDPAINPVEGDNVTQIGIGVGDEHWGGPRCWVLLTAPDGTQYVIQRDQGAGSASDDEWAKAYSPGANFSLAAANANTAPIATDEIDLVGILNTNWPAFHQVGGATNLIHIAADDALSPTGFSGSIVLELINPNEIRSVCLIDDFRDVPRFGEFEAHAKVFHFHTGDDALDYDQIDDSSSGPKGIIDYGGGGEVWKEIPYHTINDNVGLLFPGNAGAPSSGDVLPQIFLGNRTDGGFAGTSRWLRWQATNRVYPDRCTGELFWFIGDVAIQDLPDGSTIPSTI